MQIYTAEEKLLKVTGLRECPVTSSTRPRLHGCDDKYTVVHIRQTVFTLHTKGPTPKEFSFFFFSLELLSSSSHSSLLCFYRPCSFISYIIYTPRTVISYLHHSSLSILPCWYNFHKYFWYSSRKFLSIIAFVITPSVSQNRVVLDDSHRASCIFYELVCSQVINISV